MKPNVAISNIQVVTIIFAPSTKLESAYASRVSNGNVKNARVVTIFVVKLNYQQLWVMVSAHDAIQVYSISRNALEAGF